MNVYAFQPWLRALVCVVAAAAVVRADDVDRLRATLDTMVILPEEPEASTMKLKIPGQTNDVDGTDEELTLDTAPLTRAFELLSVGKVIPSLDSFNQALEEEPKSIQARFGKGTALIKLNRVAEALEILEPLADERPNNYLVKNNIAWLYATSKDPAIRNGKKATRIAQEALLLRPGDYHVWSTLAEAYYISGDYKKALRAAVQALQIGKEKNANPINMWNYTEQVRKCRQAVNALTLIE